MKASRWLKIGLAAATVFALYALAAMLLGPRIAERQLRQYLVAPGGLEVAIGRVRVDPFTLVAEFQNLVLSRPGETPVLAAESVLARFAVSGLWRRGMHLSRLELLRPRVSLTRMPQDVLGLSRWIAERAAADRPLQIHQFGIHDGTLRLALPGDRPRMLDFERLALNGSDLGGANGARAAIHLQARHSLGGSLTIEARADLNPLASSGTFSFDVPDLAAVGRWLEGGLGDASGRVTIGGEFDLAGHGRASLALSGVSLHGEAVELRNAAGDDSLRLDDAQLTGLDVDFEQRGARATQIAIDGGAAAVGEGSWQRAARHFAGSPWTVRAERIETRRLELNLGAAGRVWRLGDAELELIGFDSGAGARANFTLAAMLGPDAPLRARGWVAATTPALEATVDLTGLDLGAMRPPLSLGSGLDVGSGDASAEADVSLASGRSRVEGRAELTGFTLIDRSSRRRLLFASGVELDGIVVDGATAAPSIERVRLREPKLALALDGDGRLHPQSWPQIAAAMPIVMGRIEIAGGGLTVTDARLTPPVEIKAVGLSGAADGLHAGAGGTASLELEGRINETAAGKLAVNWRPGGVRRQGVIELDLKGIDQPLLNAYAARFAGREISSGSLNLALRYFLRGNRYRGRQRLMLDQLRLGQPVEAIGAPPLELDLAVALLADRAGRIDVIVPAAGTVIDGAFDLGAAVGQGLATFLTGVEAAPFQPLAELVGHPGENLGVIGFEPGSAAITAASERRLAALREALVLRPALGLGVAGGYAPGADRVALARQQVRLHVALATAAGPSAATDPGPLAFADGKVQSVLDEFAGERLSGATLAAINKRHAGARGVAFYRALFEALVANEPIGELALKKLARYRAQSITGRLIELGLSPERLRLAEPSAVASDTGRPVPVALQLVVLQSTEP